MNRLVVAAGAAFVFIACGAFITVRAASSSTTGAAASVNHQIPETGLLTVSLTPDAERRLGIETTPARREMLARTRLYGGEIVAPPRTKDSEVGTVYPGGVAGSLYQLADARIAATGRVEQVAAQLKGARLALVRAERMLADESGSARAVEEARIAVAMAEADHRAAVARRDLLGRTGSTALSRVWVRMPVFAGELSSLRTDAEVRVSTFDESETSGLQLATRVQAPRSADPAAGTIDLFYEMSTANGAFLPGQRVRVMVPMAGNAEQLVVPWSAILQDVNGGAWVYERVGERVYARKPVQVQAIVGDLAALKSGPAPGAAIVTTGAAELFGTEFGVPH